MYAFTFKKVHSECMGPVDGCWREIGKPAGPRGRKV